MKRWDEEKIELLKVLQAQGLTFSEMAKKIGATRSAIAGKLMRLGLACLVREKYNRYRNKPKSVGNPSRPRAAARKAPIPPMDLAAATPLNEPVPYRINILDAHDGVCRWPVGNPGDPDFGLCGHHTQGRGPYCPFHTKQSLSEPSPTKTRFHLNWIP